MTPKMCSYEVRWVAVAMLMIEMVHQHIDEVDLFLAEHARVRPWAVVSKEDLTM